MLWMQLDGLPILKGTSGPFRFIYISHCKRDAKKVPTTRARLSSCRDSSKESEPLRKRFLFRDVYRRHDVRPTFPLLVT